MELKRMMTLEERIEALYDIDSLTQKSRKRDIVTARMMYAYMRHRVNGDTYQSIAKDLGYEGHSTVIHLVKQADSLLTYDKGFMVKFNSLLSNENPELFEINKRDAEIRRLTDKLAEVESILPKLQQLDKYKRQEVIEKINIIIEATLRNM